MSLIKSKQLFAESAFPITVETVVNRTLLTRDLHRHEYYEMIYVVKGVLINRFKGSEVKMHPGDVLLMKPYLLHVLDDAVKKQARKAYCCSFLPQAVDLSILSLEQLKASDSPNRYFFKPFMPLTEEDVSAVQLRIEKDQRETLSELFRQLRDTTHDFTERGNALTRCRFLGLLEFMAERYEQSHGKGQDKQVGPSLPVSRYQSGMRKTLNYIHDHFQDSISLKDMAAMSGASETYFCRLFRHETGMTFLNYLTGLRIERACFLLRDTTDSALDICYQVGFNDYTHFGRQFRKQIGMSPAQFRKTNPNFRRIHEV